MRNALKHKLVKYIVLVAGLMTLMLAPAASVGASGQYLAFVPDQTKPGGGVSDCGGTSETNKNSGVDDCGDSLNGNLDAPTCSDKTAAGVGCIKKKYVAPTVKALTALVALAVVIGVIVGGIQYSTSAGDPQKAAAAKAKITKALVALVVYIFLFAILQFIIPGGIGV